MKLLFAAFVTLFITGAGDPPAALLNRNWYFSYMRVGGQVQEVPLKVPAAKRPWFYFGKDGSYKQSMDGVTDSGTWTYDSGSKRLNTSAQTKHGLEATVFLLERVTDDSLELREPDGAILGMVRK
ncbi:MAG: hypothetical protein EOP50_12015 [Sphingobacteriales bacterium]|nr:MAG: hypothetical protein EOP50_12015 [Sphingobacteriales bacterium]